MCMLVAFLYFSKMSRNYKFHNKSGLYFVSFATVYWIDVFTREKYLSIPSQSIDYCRTEKLWKNYYTKSPIIGLQ